MSLHSISSIALDKGLNKENLKECFRWGAYSSWAALTSDLAVELLGGGGYSVIRCAFSLQQINSVEGNS